VTLFLAREEAQRAADAGALAAARFISFSGLTSDPNNTSGLWTCVCGNPGPGCGTINGQPLPAALATTAAQAAAGASTVSGAGGNATTAFSVNVNYVEVASGAALSSTDCTTFSAANSPFSVNPMVTVQVTRTGLPTFFSRIWGNTGNTTSALATAETFNSSFSAAVNSSGAITPVQPRCVKPWFVPNQDPLNPASCTGGGCKPFVYTSTGPQGQIVNPGVSTDGRGTNGVVGEEFTLFANCRSYSNSCHLPWQPVANHASQPPPDWVPTVPNLAYVPAQVLGTPVAVPSGAAGDTYQEAIGGCDQTTVYQCGVQNANNVDLAGVNPVRPAGSGATTTGVMALIHQGNAAGTQSPTGTGQDYFNPYGIRSTDAPQIVAGSSNPLGISNLITASNSIVSLPIYDSGTTINNYGTTPVTVVGFLQVFINGVGQYGDVDVSVMNVVGCGNGIGTTLNPAVTGSSPVPVRLVTPPTS
jgi:hypothetical protein